MGARYHRRVLSELLDGLWPRRSDDDLQSTGVNWEAVEYHLDKYLSYVKRQSNNKLWQLFGELLFGYDHADCIEEFGTVFVADVVAAIRDESEKHYRSRALHNVQVFYVEAEEFLDRSTWMFERWAEAAADAQLFAAPSSLEAVLDELHERLDCEEPDPTALELLHELNGLTVDLSGFYWWNCTPGCLPDSDAHGPFEAQTEAEDDAVEMNGDDGYAE